MTWKIFHGLRTFWQTCPHLMPSDLIIPRSDVISVDEKTLRFPFFKHTVYLGPTTSLGPISICMRLRDLDGTTCYCVHTTTNHDIVGAVESSVALESRP